MEKRTKKKTPQNFDGHKNQNS